MPDFGGGYDANPQRALAKAKGKKKREHDERRGPTVHVEIHNHAVGKEKHEADEPEESKENQQ
jgi:hypothetical protein